MKDKDEVFKAFLNHQWSPNWDIHPAESPLEMVIVEPRAHEYLPKVLKNMSSMVPHAMLTILHSKDNVDMVRDTVYPNGVNNVRMIPYFEGNSSRDDYNKLMMSPEFWSILRAPKTLIFQIDSGMRYNHLLRFMQYDYIGAPWAHIVSREFPMTNIGNGGFSLRTKSYMEDIIQKHPCQVTPDILPEDVYFGTHIRLYDESRIPTFEEGTMFSLEGERHPNPMAFHQCFKPGLHPPPYLKSLLVSNVACLHPRKSVQIQDAWIENEHGHIHRSPDLIAWLNIGVSSYGFQLPKDTYISCIDKDPFPGYRKFMKIKVSIDNREMRLYTVRLNKNKTDGDLIIGT